MKHSFAELLGLVAIRFPASGAETPSTLRRHVVGGRRRLPGLSALVPGLRRRRRRRPAAGSRRASTTSQRSAWTRCGCRPSIPRRWPTSATTSPTTRRSTRSTGRSTTSTRSWRRRTSAACGCSWTSSPATRRSSTRGSASTPTATSGPTATSRPTTGSRPSAARPGRATSAAGAGTCTPSIPSSPTSTGATPRSSPRCRTSCASGSTGASTASASTRSTGCSRTRTCATTRPPARRRRFRCSTTTRRSSTSTRSTRPTSRRRWRRCARRPATPSWSARSTCPPPSLAPYLAPPRRRLLLRAAARPAGRASAARGARGGARAGRRAPGCSPTTTSAALATHFGRERERVAMLLLLTLPGVAFVYQGDEIGMAEGPGRDPPLDRAGRDRTRHPMQWDGTPLGGFTTGEPWLPVVDAPAAQRRRPARRPGLDARASPAAAIALRRELGGGARFLDAADGVLAFQRGSGHVVALNLAGEPRPAPPAGELRLATDGASSGRRAARRSARTRASSRCRRRSDPVRARRLPRWTAGYRNGAERVRQRRGFRPRARVRGGKSAVTLVRFVAGIAVVGLVVVAASGCGSSSSGSSSGVVNWYVFNEPSGAYKQAAANCSKGKPLPRQGRVRCPPTPTSSASSSSAAWPPRTPTSTSSAWT